MTRSPSDLEAALEAAGAKEARKSFCVEQAVKACVKRGYTAPESITKVAAAIETFMNGAE